MLRSIARRSYSTLKSKDDELLNKDLLNRLKQIPIPGKKVTRIVNTRDEDDHQAGRNLSLEKLDRLVKFNTTDPLKWSPYTLSRIFRLPDNYCEQIVHYVKPMVRKLDSRSDEPQDLLKYFLVVDVARLKHDKTYFAGLRELVFHETS